jgi:hypothetical protein
VHERARVANQPARLTGRMYPISLLVFVLRGARVIPTFSFRGAHACASFQCPRYKGRTHPIAREILAPRNPKMNMNPRLSIR